MADPLVVAKGVCRVATALGLEAKWPLVGRAAELDYLSRMLTPGGGAVVLAGPAGVGKSRLGLELVDIAASKGFLPLRVAATKSSYGLPFGAYAHLVPDAISSADRLLMLRYVADAVAGRGEGNPVVVLVDDAHLLDEASAALTHMLAATRRAFVIATLRSGEPAPDSITALWKDGLAERLDLEPLTIEQIRDLLQAVLGAAVDGVTVYRFVKRSQGNVLFLRELVLSAVVCGALQREEGVWRLRGSLPTSDRVVEIIEGRLAELDERARRTLEILAVGEPLELALLQKIEDQTDLDALERRGFVRIEKDDRRLVIRLPHPLYGEVLRERISAMLAREAAAVLALNLLRTGARRRGDTLRLAVWAVDGEVSIESTVLVAAGIQARQLYDFALSERLARAAWAAGADFEAGLLMSQASWLQGRGEEALLHLKALDSLARDDRGRALLATARIGVLDWSLKRPADALRVAAEAEAAISDEGYKDHITAEKARILGRSGRNAEAVAIALPLLPRASGAALVSACFAAGTSMATTGQFTGAIEASERGLAAHLQLEGPPLPFGPYLHSAIRSKALMGLGRLAEAGELAEREYNRAVKEGSLEAQSFHSFELAHTLLLAGRVATAARIAGESAGAFRELRWRLWIRNSLGVRAHALALLQQGDAAFKLMSEIDELDVPDSELLGPEVLQARAWTELALGNFDAALSRLREAVEMAQSSGAHALELAALHDVARLGRAADVVERLRQLTALVEGALAKARADHASAVAAINPDGLEEAASSFEDCGAVLFAAEAAADAAVAWRRRGQPRRATAAERRSRVLADRCEGARTPSLTVFAPARAALTRRELEIARLAARGLSDKEVAARLFLSHRTIENHLHSVYEKLGLQGRSELLKALEGNSTGLTA